MNDNNPLLTVVNKVLETWAMVFVDPINVDTNTAFISFDRIISSEIIFKGVIEGRLIVIAPEELAMLIATNVLGCDKEDVNNESIVDVIKELANVIGGNFVTEAYGTDTAFEIVPPTFADYSKDRFINFDQNTHSVKVSADGMPLAVGFMVEHL